MLRCKVIGKVRLELTSLGSVVSRAHWRLIPCQCESAAGRWSSGAWRVCWWCTWRWWGHCWSTRGQSPYWRQGWRWRWGARAIPWTAGRGCWRRSRRGPRGRPRCRFAPSATPPAACSRREPGFLRLPNQQIESPWFLGNSILLYKDFAFTVKMNLIIFKSINWNF